MLPVVDKPAIQYVVEEAVRAGPRRRPHDHRAQQAAAGGPLRPRRRARADPRGEGRRGAPGAGPAQPASSRPCTTCARATRRASATPCSRPRSTSATSRSRCCSATTSSTSATRCSSRWSRCRPSKGGSVVALMEVPHDQISHVRLRRGRGRPATSSASPAGREAAGRRGAERPRHHRPLRARPAVFDVLRTHPPGRGGEIQLTDALQELHRDRAGARRRLPRPPLRHRRPARLPQGGRAARRRPRRPRPAAARLAAASGWPTPPGRPARDHRRRAPRPGPGRRPAAVRRSTSASWTRTAACSPRTSSRRRRCRASTTARWTATPCGSTTSRGASEGSPVVLPVTGDVAAGPGLAAARPARGLRPDHDRRDDPGRRRRGRPGRVDRRRRRARVTINRGPDAGRPRPARRRGRRARARRCSTAGTHLGAAQIGLAAAVGRSRLLVRPRPRVVVVSTGSELVEPGEPLGPGRIADSNSPALTAAALEAGAIAYRVGIVPDDPRQLADTLEDQLVRADVLVTSGGVSVGAYDVVKEVLVPPRHRAASTRSRCSPACRRASAPSAPTARRSSACPATRSARWCRFEAFVRPALRKMLGATPLERPRVRAVTTKAADLPAGQAVVPARRRSRCETGAYVVTPVSRPGLAPARRHGPRQRARGRPRGRRARCRAAARSRSSCWSGAADERLHPPRRGRRRAHGRRRRQGRHGADRDRDRPGRPVARVRGAAARRGRAQGRRARRRAGRRDHGRQAHPRPGAAVPPDRAVRRDGRPRGRRRGRRRHARPPAPPTAPASRWRR